MVAPEDGGGDNDSIGREQEGIPRTPLPVPRLGSRPAGSCRPLDWIDVRVAGAGVMRAVASTRGTARHA